jgi:hypothetical protein
VLDLTDTCTNAYITANFKTAVETFNLAEAAYLEQGMKQQSLTVATTVDSWYCSADHSPHPVHPEARIIANFCLSSYQTTIWGGNLYA